MSTLVDYLNKTSDQSFDDLPFNEVDGLVLAYAASFLHYTNVRKQGSVSFSELKDEKGMRRFTSQPKHPDNRALFESLSRSKRYGEVAMIHPLEVIKPKEKVKFRAMTYQLPNAQRVATFKGSDSSLLSWEENCQMFLKKPLPAVLSAVEYLKETIAQSDHDYYIAGYSKGGYIASAANLMLPEAISEQILAVYSYDGPGISHIEELNASDKKADFERHKFIPQESYIGALFENAENVQVVESTASGLDQHTPHSWNIQNNQLVRVPEVSKKSARLSRLVNNLVDASDEKKAMETVDYWFALIKENNMVSIRDLKRMNIQKLRSIHRQDLANKNRGYSFWEFIKLLTAILSGELITATASVKERKLKQFKQLKSRLVKEVEKVRLMVLNP